MPKLRLALGWALLGGLAIAFSPIDDLLFRARVEEAFSQETQFTDAATVLAVWLSKIIAPQWAVRIVSWVGWALAPLLLITRPIRRSEAAMALHPASLILAAGGMGFAASAMCLFFVSIDRIAINNRPEAVPALGITLLLLALAVPRFEVIAVALAAPLFLIAPQEMLARNMVAFYLIILMPLTVAIALGTIFLGLPPDSVSGRTAPFAALPLIIAAPMLVLLSVPPDRRRSAAALGVISVGLLVTPGSDPLFAFLVLSLAGSFAVRGTRPFGVELVLAATTTVAACLAALHIAPL